AELRIVPTGILPQGRTTRVVLTPDFKDLVGEGNLVPIAVASFMVGVATDPGTSTPGDGADEVKEPFDVHGSQPGSLEDTTSAFVVPRAVWGNGELVAAFAFEGTGGPGGNFDWVIGSDTGPPETFLLDTTFSVITNVTQSATEAVVNGVVDIRSLTVKANGT